MRLKRGRGFTGLLVICLEQIWKTVTVTSQTDAGLVALTFRDYGLINHYPDVQ